MDRYPVISTNLATVGYDDIAGMLEVEFKNGRVYQYLDVPRMHFDAILRAGSPGEYFNANIKPFYGAVRM
jgi:hypothetical protein